MTDIDWLLSLTSFDIFAISLFILAIVIIFMYLKHKKQSRKVDKVAGDE